MTDNPFNQLLAQAASQADQPVSSEEFTCDECGARTSMLPPVNLQVMSDAEHINMYVIDGAGGLCRQGRHFICSKHIEFRNLDAAVSPDLGRWVLACKEHGGQVEGISAEAMTRWRDSGGEDRLKELHQMREGLAAVERATERVEAGRGSRFGPWGEEPKEEKRSWFRRRKR